jgi:hypothetical protein
MMKTIRLSIFLFLSFCSLENHAQKFHLIVVGDTQDESIGKSCDRDIDRLSSEANTICRSINFTLNKVIIKGENFEPDALKKALKSLICAENDIIYFHYSGHGKRNANTETRWPDLDFRSKGTLPLSEISEMIGGKAARLKLIVADCCNQYSETTERPTFQPIPALEGSEAEDNRKKLFAESACFVVSSGSQPGQFSYANTRDGGFFTNAFLEALQYTIVATHKADWNSVFADAQLRTKKKATKNYKRQIPQYQFIEEEENKEIPPSMPMTKNINTQADLVQINEYLNNLVSTDLSDKDKEKSIKNFTKYFHAKARVDVYKNTTLVDRERIEDFLNRIYLESKQIHHINLIEKSCQLKDGKYEVITVQEIRD